MDIDVNKVAMLARIKLTEINRIRLISGFRHKSI